MGKCLSTTHTFAIRYAKTKLEKAIGGKSSTISISFHIKNPKLWGVEVSENVEIVIALTNFRLAGGISSLKGFYSPNIA